MLFSPTIWKTKTNPPNYSLYKQYNRLFFSQFGLIPMMFFFEKKLEKVYFRSQILERPSIGEYCNIFGVPVLLKCDIYAL